MSEYTTIKVPRTLRDRLALRAASRKVTLAGAIAGALDESEERAFWTQVRREHAALSDHDRRQYVSDPTLADHLSDADDSALGEDGW